MKLKLVFYTEELIEAGGAEPGCGDFSYAYRPDLGGAEHEYSIDFDSDSDNSPSIYEYRGLFDVLRHIKDKGLVGKFDNFDIRVRDGNGYFRIYGKGSSEDSDQLSEDERDIVVGTAVAIAKFLDWDVRDIGWRPAGYPAFKIQMPLTEVGLDYESFTAGHTAGPWVVTVPPSSTMTHRFIEAVRDDGSNVTIAEVGGQYSSGPDKTISEHVANAKLMAAADEMLKALEDARKALENQLELLNHGVFSTPADIKEAISKITATINKAR